MIRITNQEEFEKCCELINSIDKESRLLGWSLIQDCMKVPENLYIRVTTPDFINNYEFMYYMQKRLLVKSNIKPGILLYDLIFKGKYKYHNQLATLFIKDDQSN
jgi:hypothetical protein